MTYPTHGFDIAFTTDPLDTPAWEPLEDRLHGISTQSGRQKQLDEYDTATASMQVDNSDRALDPLHTAGPYFGDLKPRKRCRWQAVHDGTTYDLFGGFVNGFAQQFSPPEVSLSPLAAGDWLKILAGMELPPSVYFETVTDAAPDHWWPLDETAGDAAKDRTGGESGIYEGTLRRGESSPTTYDHRPATGFGGDDANRVAVAESASFTTSTVRVAFVMQTEPFTDSLTDPCVLIEQDDLATGVRVEMGQVGGADEGKLIYTVGLSSVVSTVRVDDDVVHDVICRYGASQAIYIDGVKLSEEWFPGSIVLAQTPTAGPIYFGASALADRAYPGVLRDVQFYSSDISAATASVYSAALHAPWNGDTTGERVDRVLDLFDIDPADRNIDGGFITLGPADFAGMSALAYCQLMARTEHGGLYADQADGGKIRFEERDLRYRASRSTIPRVEFTDAEDEGATLTWDGDTITWDGAALTWGTPAAQFHFDPSDLVYLFDEDLVFNDITVSWVGGEVNVEDATSITEHTRKNHSVDTALPSEGDALALATLILERFKDPYERVPAITITPSSDHRLWHPALTLRIGDRVSIRHHPQEVGDPLEFQCWIEGISRQVSDGVNGWSTTFSLSAAA